jgi:hypothetical protein
MIAPDLVMDLTGAGSALFFGPGQVRSLDEVVRVILEFVLSRSRLTACMNDARQRSTSKNTGEILGAPQMLGSVVQFAGASCCVIRWRYRTYHAPWSSYRQPF